ncbi:hypothetical protein ACJJTC_001835, partial [Scirpophaga incertulas]
SQISIVGGQAFNYFKNFATIHKSKDLEYIRTANDSTSEVIGYLLLPVLLNNKIRVIKFFVVPGVATELLFGLNFWKIFNIAPDVLSLLQGNEHLYRDNQVNSIITANR